MFIARLDGSDPTVVVAWHPVTPELAAALARPAADPAVARTFWAYARRVGSLDLAADGYLCPDGRSFDTAYEAEYWISISDKVH